MYGASAVHGIVNLLTPQRALDLPDFSAGIEGGSDSFKRLRFSGSRTFSGEARAGIGAYGVGRTRRAGATLRASRKPSSTCSRDVDVGGGQLRLRAAGTVLNQETAGFIQGYNSYQDEDIARRPTRIPKLSRRFERARLGAICNATTVFGDGLPLRTRRHLPALAHGFPAALPDRQAVRAQRADQLPGEQHAAMNSSPANSTARVALDAETASSELTEFQPDPVDRRHAAAKRHSSRRPSLRLHGRFWTLGATFALECRFLEI